MRDSVSPNSIVRPAPEVVFQWLEEEVVLLNLDSGMYYGLEPVGARIWKLIENPQSLATVIAQVEREFDVEHSRVESDVLGLVGELQKSGLVTVENPPEELPQFEPNRSR